MVYQWLSHDLWSQRFDLSMITATSMHPSFQKPEVLRLLSICMWGCYRISNVNPCLQLRRQPVLLMNSRCIIFWPRNHGVWLPQGERVRYNCWRIFERAFSDGTHEERYIREIVFGKGKKRLIRYWEITTDPATLPANSTGMWWPRKLTFNITKWVISMGCAIGSNMGWSKVRMNWAGPILG